MLLAKKNFQFNARFKSAILAKLKNCQNGTFEPVPNPGFMQEKEEKKGIEKLFLF